MKILQMGCTHTKHYNIPWKFDPGQADIVIHTGDLSSVGSRWDVKDFLDWFTYLPIKHKIFIAGNHDRTFDPWRGGNTGEKPYWLKEMIADFEDDSQYNHYLENSGIEVDGIKIWGSPITPWFHGTNWAFNKHREEIGETWKEIPKDTDILITHGPVWGIHDYTLINKTRVGCEALAEKVEEVNPLLYLCSHIHEGYGYAYVGETHYFNGSIMSLSDNPINEPWLIDANFKERKVTILNEKHKQNV